MRILSLTLLLFFLAADCASVNAQSFQTSSDDDWCDDDRYYSDRETHCEVREATLPAGRDVVAIDGGRNGGIRVQGWDRNEIRVRVKVKATATTRSRAREIADAITIDTQGIIRANDFDTRRRESMSVSYDVFVPFSSDLDLETHNGGITIKDVAGDIRFSALNGGVSLSALAGDVRGKTTNGGLEVKLEGDSWRGAGLDVATTNGGVRIIIPDGYSANLESGTVNGQIDLDFPVTVQGRLNRHITTKLGEGEPAIRAVTTNGGVRIQRG